VAWQSSGDLTVVDEAAGGEEVVRLAQQLKPDVRLRDIRQHGTATLTATASWPTCLDQESHQRVGYQRNTYPDAAVKCGVDTFLPTGAEISEPLSVIGWRGRPCVIASNVQGA